MNQYMIKMTTVQYVYNNETFNVILIVGGIKLNSSYLLLFTFSSAADIEHVANNVYQILLLVVQSA